MVLRACGEPEFGSQHSALGSSQPPVTPALETLVPSAGLNRHCTHMYTPTCINTHTHTKLKNIFYKENVKLLMKINAK